VTDTRLRDASILVGPRYLNHPSAVFSNRLVGHVSHDARDTHDTHDVHDYLNRTTQSRNNATDF
jgi:hypothetical protein